MPRGCGAAAHATLATADMKTAKIVSLLLLLSLGSLLSSPRAESARAVTGRRNSHRWEGGRLFEPSAGFFTETAVTLEQKVEKSFPRWEIKRHAEG